MTRNNNYHLYCCWLRCRCLQ